jgi:hypothetical protein
VSIAASCWPLQAHKRVGRLSERHRQVTTSQLAFWAGCQWELSRIIPGNQISLPLPLPAVHVTSRGRRCRGTQLADSHRCVRHWVGLVEMKDAD